LYKRNLADLQAKQEHAVYKTYKRNLADLQAKQEHAVYKTPRISKLC
jgi:hypothetical protein